MSYQIKEVSELLGISIYTLHYYERIGLLNNVKRDQYGRREFSEDDILTLNTVECLKQTGMSLQNIKRYVQLVGEGIGLEFVGAATPTKKFTKLQQKL